MRVVLPLVALAALASATDESVAEKRDLIGGILSGVGGIVAGTNVLLCTLLRNCPTSTSAHSQPTSSTTKVLSSITVPTATVTTPTATLTSIPILTTATATSKPSQFLLSPSFVITSIPTTRQYNFVIDARKGSPDGFQRTMFLVNGQSEGPLIEANQGDTIHVHVVNNLNTGIAMHWHGMAQNGTAWADGPNGITQCPIPPGGTFDYIFVLNRHDQYGTYWWHAHRGAMYADGLTGPFVIHSPNDPLQRGVDYDIDQIMFIRDNFHSMSTDIVDGLLSAAGFAGTIVAPSPKSGLLNGEGVFNCTKAPLLSTCVQKAPIEFVFPPNKKIRLRLVNAGTHAMFRVSVDKHMINVIEADDTPVFGPSVHRVPIFVAQRYSIVLDTSGDRQGDSFYFRAQMNTACFAGDFSDLDPDVRAIIRISQPYLMPSKGLPTTVDWTDALGGVCKDLDEGLLVPRIASNAPARASIVGQFNAAFNFTQVGVFEWTLNGVSLENFMYNAFLFQVHRGETIDTSQVTSYTIDGIQTADLIINNVLGADHPFHLHASKFWIVARGSGIMQTANVGSLKFNTTNPLRRDVLTVPAGDYAVIRIISDIPGVHAFHCHIAWHQAAGLFGVFIVQPNQVRQMVIPQAALNMCSAFEGSDTLLTTDPGRKRALLDAGPDTLGRKFRRENASSSRRRKMGDSDQPLVHRSAGHGAPH